MSSFAPSANSGTPCALPCRPDTAASSEKAGIIVTAHRLICSALAGAVALFVCAVPAHAQKELKELTQPEVRDLYAEINVISKDDGALRKISKTYVDAMAMTQQEIWCREPGQVRLQGKRGLFTARFITNGNRKLIEVPTIRFREVEDITDAPGKGDSISDLGMLTTSWVNSVNSRWIRTEPRDGKTLQVFEFFHPRDAGLRHTIFVDPATRTVVEHIVHNRGRRSTGFKKRIVYSDVKTYGGVSVPTRAVLYNGEGKQAAVMSYEKIKINQGVAESLFKI